MDAKPVVFTEKEQFFIDQAHRSGVANARLGVFVCPHVLDCPDPADAFYVAKSRAFRTGYRAELVRIANRRTTGEQRDFLIAHDRAVAAWKRAPSREDDNFVRADMVLFGLNPWQTLGISLGQYQGPAAQSKDRIYDPALLARA